ncbi:helix-turn-helix domain-containing protein [Sinomicrobium soli]|uniref:helix-turn-helix domain-containing protein n=1 Tax=Sinomicrobium sp. N-1-3-6 TaxID=2219864 RepID=UPI000DCBA9D0|nr:helix-turn-helix transcriptional regulator [Sinomicrobium sp. N-1-3-6]RAV28505.1 hypothetical protein DN748_12855 [Sinomicrobium sp. N-1-3-6]
MDKNDFNRLLGSFVKARRLERKWSQSVLAARAGNNYQNISAIERGEVSPTLYWICEKLAPALETDPKEFISELFSYMAKERAGRK